MPRLPVHPQVNVSVTPLFDASTTFRVVGRQRHTSAEPGIQAEELPHVAQASGGKVPVVLFVRPQLEQPNRAGDVRDVRGTSRNAVARVQYERQEVKSPIPREIVSMDYASHALPTFADLGPAGLAELIETNEAEFLMALGRAGGGEVRDDARLRWVIGGSPVDYHNAVVHADLVSADVDAAIDEVVERLRHHRVPGTWHVGPLSRPTDLGNRLRARGFTGGGSDTGMAADLQTLATEPPSPEDVAITRIRDSEGLATWARIRALDPEGEVESNWVAETYRRIGLGDDVPWRHYLGWLDGRPVATATLFLGAGVAGIYFVLTVPDARRRGIGAAITHAAMRDAHHLGYRTAVLGASQMGHRVYEGLGFREFCRNRVYEWHPTGAT